MPCGYGSFIDRATPPAVVDYVRAEMTAGAPRVGAELFSSLLALDARDHLAAISCPSLLLLGNRRWVTNAAVPDVLERLGYAALPGLPVLLVTPHPFRLP